MSLTFNFSLWHSAGLSGGTIGRQQIKASLELEKCVKILWWRGNQHRDIGPWGGRIHEGDPTGRGLVLQLSTCHVGVGFRQHPHAEIHENVVFLTEPELVKETLVLIRPILPLVMHDEHGAWKGRSVAVITLINLSINPSIIRSINGSINESIHQSTFRWIKGSINQSLNQTIKRSSQQSINQSTERLNSPQA